MLATIGGAITVLNPAPEDEAFVTDMTLGLFVLVLVTVGIGLWAKNIYVRARQRMLDQQYARQHLSTLFAQLEFRLKTSSIGVHQLVDDAPGTCC